MYKFVFSLIIFCLITLPSCSDEQPKWQKIEKQAEGEAKALDADNTLAYLQCYALDYQTKKQCVQQLNDQYITNAEYKTDLYYQKSFQYQAEKLGFLNFLRSHNLPCSGIDYGPQFVKNANAYRAICNCEHHHLLKFDYVEKIWQAQNNIITRN